VAVLYRASLCDHTFFAFAFGTLEGWVEAPQITSDRLFRHIKKVASLEHVRQ
jgi:hypothetical protein